MECWALLVGVDRLGAEGGGTNLFDARDSIWLEEASMRGLILTLAAAGMAIAGAPSAFAAPVPAYSWTGCYIGAHAGAASSHTVVTDEVDGYEIATLNASAAAGGVQGGCDYQFSPQWVAGFQGMYTGTGLTAATTSDILDPLTLHGAIPWVATFTGRIGFLPKPDFLIYAKGGAAWNHTDAKLMYDDMLVSEMPFDQTGWTLGLGAEKKMGMWSVFAEYNYLGFTPQEVSFPGPDIGVVNQNVQLFTVGVNLRFGGP
jgi:outer membrane immunogenic protein